MTKIAVALSGGVDSSLTVKMLCDAGHEVIGVTLCVQHEGEGATVCAGDSAVAKARAAAQYLGIEHHVLDVCDDFRASVLEYAWHEYSHSRTPAPCVQCNEQIKFGKLLDYALSLGCEKMATGHYARIVDYHGVKRIARGVDGRKDQSYFLSGLSNDVVSRVLFPLGSLEKTRVRVLAAEYGLPAAQTPDSQNVCITRPGETFAETLCHSFDGRPVIGNFTMNGRILAPHLGIHRYTVGQRHGLGNLVPTKATLVKSIGERDIEVTTNVRDLDSRELRASRAVWHTDSLPEGLEGQIRYRSQPVGCRVKRDGERVEVQFDAAVHAVTPGQVIAFYDGDVVVGRAIIEG
ncbi:MAG: tRNA 2-thiouridine(34) synthase MnmA [Bradymonadia bacterium]